LLILVNFNASGSGSAYLIRIRKSQIDADPEHLNKYLDIIAVDADAVLPEEAILDEGSPRVQQVHQLVSVHLQP
jgi:hypothetical protein